MVCVALCAVLFVVCGALCAVHRAMCLVGDALHGAQCRGHTVLKVSSLHHLAGQQKDAEEHLSASVLTGTVN